MPPEQEPMGIVAGLRNLITTIDEFHVSGPRHTLCPGKVLKFSGIQYQMVFYLGWFTFFISTFSHMWRWCGIINRPSWVWEPGESKGQEKREGCAAPFSLLRTWWPGILIQAAKHTLKAIDQWSKGNWVFPEQVNLLSELSGELTWFSAFSCQWRLGLNLPWLLAHQRW